mmetsp:Transcript_28986/g.46830  ORF Transcript_28986/g.46830 Transcript_28986/m.46830 type:complete len:84 (-) Transcript_28986:120-371(-)
MASTPCHSISQPPGLSLHGKPPWVQQSTFRQQPLPPSPSMTSSNCSIGIFNPKGLTGQRQHAVHCIGLYLHCVCTIQLVAIDD